MHRGVMDRSPQHIMIRVLSCSQLTDRRREEREREGKKGGVMVEVKAETHTHTRCFYPAFKKKNACRVHIGRAGFKGEAAGCKRREVSVFCEEMFPSCNLTVTYVVRSGL